MDEYELENADKLGRIVREAWVAYCIETGDTKPSHITPYDELSEWDKEADRRIGLALQKYMDAEFGELLNELMS